MIKKLVSILFVCLLTINLSLAQELKRKAMLGITMQSLTESLASQNKIQNRDGLFLSTVVPNSTFANLGVKEGDVLTQLNGKNVSTIQDVLQISSSLLEGDKVSAVFYSKDKKKEATAKAIKRPFEVFRNGNVEYGQVTYQGNQLRSILVTPKNKKNPPVVYFLQGYTCGSVETVSDDNPMRKLMMDWLDAGFAVYRVEKPGVGDSKSDRHCSIINFEEELTAFKEGYRDLKSKTNIDIENIFMFGHSMGGVIAPLLDQIDPPKGIMVYGTVGDNWYEYMVDLYTIQPKHFGVSDADIKEDNKVNLKFNKDFLIHKLSAKELAKNRSYTEFFDSNTLDLENSQYIGRHFSFWQSLADVNIPKTWSQVKSNVLALYGEFDIQAINAEGTKKIRDLVNNNGGSAEFKLIKKADHGFINFNSMRENVQTLNGGDYLNHARKNYSTLLSNETTKWMLSKLKS